MKGSKGKSSKPSAVAKQGGATASAQGNRGTGTTTSKFELGNSPSENHFTAQCAFLRPIRELELILSDTHSFKACYRRKLNSTKKLAFCEFLPGQTRSPTQK